MTEPARDGERAREYRILEFDKITEMLAERATMRLAAEAARALAPSRDLDEINRRQAETAEAVSVCLRKGTPPFSATPEVAPFAAYAAKGGALSMRQLLLVGTALADARRVRAFLSADLPAEVRGLRRVFEGLSVLPALENRIAVSILSESEMADSASPQLRSLRRKIEAQNEKIRERLNRYISAETADDALRERLVTLRNGRFVLPVRQEQTGRFPGIVHGRSKGGATVFIEPQAVVEMNNALRELQADEEAEVERILEEISAEVGAASGELQENQERLAELDYAFAKANLALDMDAHPPELLPAPAEIVIEKGRNPLIPKGTVVPVSIVFGTGEGRVLIITGPNTGGKTVTLKTVGLFLLMAQAGLWVPAAAARLPVVRRVFADIGDEQSIEQSLSTFSAHMTQLVRIVNEAEEEDVVLLDELGAGTDPAEGAALAIALLDTLRTRGCPVLATTHYTELKKYAVAAEGVENASMEFDVETLSPTFRLLMGSPGRSNAFEISEKLGLRPEVIGRARELLDSELVAFDEVVAELERSRDEAGTRLREAEALLSEAKEREEQAAEALRAAEAKTRDLLAGAEAKAEEILRDANEDAEEIADELKELIREARTRGVTDGASVFGGAGTADPAAAPLDAGDALRRLDNSRKKLRSKHAARGATRPQGTKAQTHPSSYTASAAPAAAGQPFAPGDFVTIPGGSSTAEVLSAPDERGRVNLLAGGLRMTLPAEILTRAESPPAGKGRRPSDGGSRYAKIVISKMDRAGASIDLHGKNLDEAELLVDKYLDDASLARMHEVMICHGRGGGILRTGIRKFLKGHPHVAAFRPGHFDEGGDGVTIVTLK